MPYLTIHTPLGELTIFEEDEAIVALDFGRAQALEGAPPPTPLLREAASQLQDYFDGTRTAFDLPLSPHGTAFRRSVWDALCRIPPGRPAAISTSRARSAAGHRAPSARPMAATRFRS